MCVCVCVCGVFIILSVGSVDNETIICNSIRQRSKSVSERYIYCKRWILPNKSRTLMCLAKDVVYGHLSCDFAPHN